MTAENPRGAESRSRSWNGSPSPTWALGGGRERPEPCRMGLRLLCVLLAAVSGARGWGYCECGARRRAGTGPGVRSAALRLGGRRSLPRRRALAGSLSPFPASPPRSAMQLGGRRARPGLGLGSGPRTESALLGFGTATQARASASV